MLLTGEMDQLGVRERRKCLFKKELRGLESVVLASWRSHQWGSTEPTETTFRRNILDVEVTPMGLYGAD